MKWTQYELIVRRLARRAPSSHWRAASTPTATSSIDCWIAAPAGRFSRIAKCRSRTPGPSARDAKPAVSCQRRRAGHCAARAPQSYSRPPVLAVTSSNGGSPRFQRCSEASTWASSSVSPHAPTKASR